MAVDNRGPPLQGVCYAFGVLALVSAFLRFYVRVRIVKSFGADDYFMVVALISFLLFAGSALLGVHFGAGRHLGDISESGRVNAIMCWWFCYLWYCLTMTATKISICYFLLRVVVSRTHLWITYAVMALNILSGIAFFFITLFQCRPVDAFWNRDPLNPGRCLGMDVVITITYVYSSCGIICDFTCTFLPMFIISGLNMDRRSKYALMPIMALACVASAATVVRFVYCKDAKDPDFLYATINIVMWSTIEQGLAVTAGSLATLRPLLRILAHRLGFTSARASEPQNSDCVEYRGQSRNKPRSQNLNGDEIRLTPVNKYHDGRQASVTANDPLGKDNTRWQTRKLPSNESEEELAGLSTNSADYGSGKILRIETFHMREDRV